MGYRKDDDEIFREDGSYFQRKEWDVDEFIGSGMEAMAPNEVIFEHCEKERREENPPYFFHHDAEDEDEE